MTEGRRRMFLPLHRITLPARRPVAQGPTGRLALATPSHAVQSVHRTASCPSCLVPLVNQPGNANWLTLRAGRESLDQPGQRVAYYLILTRPVKYNFPRFSDFFALHLLILHLVNARREQRKRFDGSFTYADTNTKRMFSAERFCSLLTKRAESLQRNSKRARLKSPVICLSFQRH